MTVTELKIELARHSDLPVRFILPDGNGVPAHAHVTEIARVDKRFVDCGGTVRADSFCRLQTWFSNDTEHRLTAGKLLKIFEKAAPILQSDALEVDVEHELNYITQFPLASVTASEHEVLLHLSERHAACLAADKCKTKAKELPEFHPLKFNFNAPQSGCCASN